MIRRFSRLVPVPVLVSLLALILLLAWDAAGFDLKLAKAIATPYGFPLRDNAFLVDVMHWGGRIVSWALFILLLVAIRWPVGPMKRLPIVERAQIVVTVLGSVLVVSLIKQGSTTSCPWDVQTFGGVAQYVSHWRWGLPDGGPGHCFPAGHASAAFAYLGAYFVWRRFSVRTARLWLAGALVGGLLLGISQQLRGAHYMSHTLWAAWFCWVTACAIEGLVRMQARRRASMRAGMPLTTAIPR